MKEKIEMLLHICQLLQHIDTMPLEIEYSEMVMLYIWRMMDRVREEMEQPNLTDKKQKELQEDYSFLIFLNKRIADKYRYSKGESNVTNPMKGGTQ